MSNGVNPHKIDIAGVVAQISVKTAAPQYLFQGYAVD
jgi:hypothetical protein